MTTTRSHSRRSFLADILKAGVAAAFLPGAGRLWKKPSMVWAPYEMTEYPDSEIAIVHYELIPFEEMRSVMGQIWDWPSVEKSVEAGFVGRVWGIHSADHAIF